MKRKSFDRWMIENIVGLLERSGDKRYADGIGKGWKLESIKPSQFSLTFYWRTTELTDKQIKANIEKLVTCDWQRKLTPLQEAVAYAQANLDAFKEELRELTAAIA